MVGGQEKSTKEKANTILTFHERSRQWVKLFPLIWFTVATLRGQLLVVGGQEKSTKEKANTILTFHERSRQWVKLFPPMPKALIVPEVVEYQNMQSYRYRWIWHK